MRWDDIRFFLAVARGGGLSAAARTLRVNHSTVFRRIDGLETALGTRLFDRLPGGYTLTRAGERMMDDALRAEDAFNDLERNVAGLDQQLTGEVRFTAPNGLAAHPLPDYLRSLRHTYPEIVLHMLIDNRVFSLKRGEADIALRPGPSASEELVGRKIATIAWTAYASPEYLARRGRPQSEAELDGHDIIACDESLSGIPAARWLTRHTPNAQVVVRADDITTMRHLCAAGLGIAVLPMWGYPDSPVPILPPVPSLATALYLYTHPDLRRVARIRAVIDHLAECFAADRERHTRMTGG